MRTVIDTYKKTWGNSVFYMKLEGYSLWRTYRFIAGILFTFLFIFVCIVLAIILPRVNSVLDTIPEIFPADVEITIENGVAKSNTPVVSPVRWPAEYAVPGGFEWVTVIATEGEQDITKIFDEFNTVSVLTRDTLAVRHAVDDERIELYPLRSIETPFTTISLTTVTEYINNNRTNAHLIVVGAMIIGLFVATFVGVMGGALMALLGSLLVYLIAGMRSLSLVFKHAYLIALYACVPVISVCLLFLLMGAILPFELLLLVYITILLFAVRERTPITIV